jgi:signal transduction histidine kinase/DNA-binding response OmpR family regulator
MGDGAPARILVVDDQPSQRLALQAALAGMGEEVTAVGSGAEALRLLLDRDVAVILLDVNMPDMDGFETAALVRQRPRSRHTPIIFLTADTDEMLQTRAYSLGAVDFILNPFTPEILCAKVRVFVELSKMQARVQRDAEQRIALMREQAARAAAEAEGRRLSFLADAGRILSRSLDTPTLVGDLLDLFVPRLTDLAAVVLAGEDRTAWRARDAAGTVTADPPPGEWALSLDHALRRAMANGEAEVLDGGAEARYGLVLPLVARGRTVGAVATAVVDDRRREAESDFGLIRLVANRAAITLDNSRLYREIQERDRQKDEFLAILSHELRNPLGAITTAAHLLEAVPLMDDRAIRARSVLVRQSAHLGRMVDDLLDMARVSSGRVSLDLVSVDLSEVVRRAVEALRVAEGLDRHEIGLRLQPTTVEADTARMEQVITNLLVNAVKYTEAGGRIEVEVGTEGTEAVVRVRDTGVGMSGEMLRRLFQPFAQEPQPLDRARGGLGLGLVLVRQLVELHGGQVEAESAGAGRGSTFTVRLPRASPAPPPRRDDPDSLRGEAPLRILIVEDNADAREMLRTLLELAGHETYEAADGMEGLRMASEVKPQVALVDLGLPELDGLELAGRIRAIPGGEAIALVALTGYGQQQDRQRTRAAGFDHHLVKPVDSETLGKVLALAARRLAPETGGQLSR